MQHFTAPTLDLNDFGDARGRTPTKTTALPELTAHRVDLYRDARRRHMTEVRVREQLGRARRPTVIHRPRSTLIAGH
jgi:hypothetical protein